MNFGQLGLMQWGQPYSQAIPLLKDHIHGLKAHLRVCVPPDILASWEGNVDGARKLYEYVNHHASDPSFLAIFKDALRKESLVSLIGGDGAVPSQLPVIAQATVVAQVNAWQDVERYRLAIVTALPKEFLAIRALLDQEYGNLRSKNVHDQNIYILGRIARHDLVLATLPAGRYGQESAASVISGLLTTFPGVRDVLVMGIAGGVPNHANSEEDVRLGDVVVSVLIGRGAIVQWDFGKQVQDHEFENRYVAPLPSRLFLGVVGALASKWELQRSPLGDYARLVPSKLQNEEKKAQYSRPNATEDRLFDATYLHVTNEVTCGRCEQAKLVARRQRASLDPRVFQGMIGSGNTLLKDAVKREQLRIKYPGLRCIEMESSGAAEAVWHAGNVGYLFVRGICDYCDTHKNDVWQEYASATAAAYVKCLLEELPV